MSSPSDLPFALGLLLVFAVTGAISWSPPHPPGPAWRRRRWPRPERARLALLIGAALAAALLIVLSDRA